MALGVGVALNNSRAVVSALSGQKGAFIRTPKAGDKVLQVYKSKFPFASVIEFAIGVYCFFGFLMYTRAEKYLVGPFLGLYAVGFCVVGYMSLAHYLKKLYIIKYTPGIVLQEAWFKKSKLDFTIQNLFLKSNDTGARFKAGLFLFAIKSILRLL